MDEETKGTEQALTACAERLTAAASELRDVIGTLAAQYETLHQKVDRIIAAVEAGEVSASARDNQQENRSAGRRTLSPVVASLLAKGGLEGEAIESGRLEKALEVLTVEQRIAVKAELARAGVIC